MDTCARNIFVEMLTNPVVARYQECSFTVIVVISANIFPETHKKAVTACEISCRFPTVVCSLEVRKD